MGRTEGLGVREVINSVERKDWEVGRKKSRAERAASRRVCDGRQQTGGVQL